MTVAGTGAQLTLRAAATGMALGAVLSLCNIYSGLRIGWGFNMSITAALVAYVGWQAAHRAVGSRPFGMLENNISQMCASAAASISSAGLVAAIPALALVTGKTLPWHALALWTFSVSAVGVAVAIGLRQSMVGDPTLPFPSGIATAETLREIYAHGREAAQRVWALAIATALAAAVKLVAAVLEIPALALPGRFALSPQSALAARGVTSVSLKNLTFALDPSLLLIGVGALVGFRGTVSLLLGALVAWGLLAPMAIDRGWATLPEHASAAHSWFSAIVPWLLWPGVAMMLTGSLTSFALGLAPMWKRARARRRNAGAAEGQPLLVLDDVPRGWFVRATIAAGLLSVVLQSLFFGVPVWAAIIGVLVTCVLAIVAGRVTAETGVPPIGAMGKVTQLLFGGLTPGDAAANLMAANVTGGAASQCGDLLQDLKTGALLGASPRRQILAQGLGIVAGALAGSAGYMLLIPHPREQLLTETWPAPAVLAWKAVAELLLRGVHGMPPGTLVAAIAGGVLGIALAVLEKTLPERLRAFVPSPSSAGLAFVMPAGDSVLMFIGGAAALLAERRAPRWSSRFVVVLAAGVIAGESLAGVAVTIWGLLLR